MSSSPSPSRSVGLSVFGTLVFWTFRVLWTSVVIVVPTVGVWVGSSLAAYHNGPVWLVCLAGLLLFPGLPVAWDLWARRKKKPKRWDDTVLTWWDRLILRTLAINLAFLTILLWAAPQQAFTALSTRGDWILDDVEHPIAAEVRPWLFAGAEGLAWLYEATHDNEYEDLVDDDAVDDVDPQPVPVDEDDPWADPWERGKDDDPGRAQEPEPRDDGDAADQKDEADSSEELWPRSAQLHPAVAKMPASAKQDIGSVGRYLKAEVTDPYERVKAIHDFVADRVAYDAPALARGVYPPQDAPTVFSTKLGVCAGYANLVKAIADVTGDTVVVVTGDARSMGSTLSGRGHAWNAAYLDERWLLIDATWDAGYVDGSRFTKRYGTAYLFTPPAVMGVTHFPDDPAWQLRTEPLTRGEFLRQPVMRPEFFAQGFHLVSPQRSQVTVEDTLTLELDNPHKRHLMVHFQGTLGSKGECRVDEGRSTEIACTFPAEDTYQVKLFSSPKRYGTYDFVGQLEAHKS